MSDFKNIAEPLMERINKLEVEKKQHLDTIMSQQETIKQQQETINNLSKTPQKCDEKIINLFKFWKKYDSTEVYTYEGKNIQTGILIRIKFNSLNSEELKTVCDNLDIQIQTYTQFLSDERINKFRIESDIYYFYMDIVKFNTIGKQFLVSVDPEFILKNNIIINDYNIKIEKLIGTLSSKITPHDNLICITYEKELFKAAVDYLTKLFNSPIVDNKELKISLDDFIKVFIPKIGFKST